MRRAANDIMSSCVIAEQLGGSKIIKYGAQAVPVAYFFKGNDDDPELHKARESTFGYRPKRDDRESKGKGTGSADAGAAGGTTGAGGTSSGANTGGAGAFGLSDNGQGFLNYYCNKVQEPSACMPGFSCVVKSVANQLVMWG